MTDRTTVAVPAPRWDHGEVAVAAPGDGPGCWAGGPSATLVDGTYYLAYRLRRPVGDGRGYAVAVARSDDGVAFETIATLDRDRFDSDSLERPALVAKPDGTWRIYVSSATTGTLHWRVEAIDAAAPDAFDPDDKVMVLPGDASTTVKDPVVICSGERWHLWACSHPLPDPAEADQMSSWYATSPDGLDWTWQGEVLAGSPGRWDSRGARITSVLLDRPHPIAFYDGRSSPEENGEERCGAAVADDAGRFTSLDLDAPVASSPHHSGCLRYVSAVALPGGGYRLYYEASRPDGAHDLRTELVLP